MQPQMRRGCCFVSTWSFESYSGISTLLQSMVEHRMPNHGIHETSLPCPMHRTCAALIRSLIVRGWPPRVYPCISTSLIDPESLLRTFTFTARTQLFPPTPDTRLVNRVCCLLNIAPAIAVQECTKPIGKHGLRKLPLLHHTDNSLDTRWMSRRRYSLPNGQHATQVKKYA